MYQSEYSYIVHSQQYSLPVSAVYAKLNGRLHKPCKMQSTAIDRPVHSEQFDQ